MPLFLDLPLEVQLEIFYWCDYRVLRRIRRTCKHFKHLIDDSAALWRSRTVNYEQLRQIKRSNDADVAAWEAQWDKEDSRSRWDKTDLVGDWIGVSRWRGRTPIELHSLLAYTDYSIGRYFGMPYERLHVTWTERDLRNADVASGGEEDDPCWEPERVRVLIHQLPEAQENATKPPVSTLVLKQGFGDVHTENMRVVSGSQYVASPDHRYGMAPEAYHVPASCTIRNEDGRPVMVEQVLRNWCFGANKIMGDGNWDGHLRGFRAFELLDDGTLVFDSPQYK